MAETRFLTEWRHCAGDPTEMQPDRAGHARRRDDPAVRFGAERLSEARIVAVPLGGPTEGVDEHDRLGSAEALGFEQRGCGAME
jgi:hypothetical protein